MSRKSIKALVWNLAWLLIAPAVAVAQLDEMVVASSGTVLKLRSGTYGSLFPGGIELSEEYSVLALDVLGSGELERVLVPQTENAYIERPVALHYENKSGRTYVLWEGLFNGVHPFLYLTSFDGNQWSEVIQISGNVFVDKGHAELVIVPERGNGRTFLYLVWREGTPPNREHYIVPIILENGDYVGWHQSFKLSRFLEESDVISGLPTWNALVDPNFEDILTIQPSARGDSVNVGFVDSRSGHLVALEFEILPPELSALAERVREFITEQGATSESIEELTGKVRAAILEYGDQTFHKGMLEHLADQVEAMLREFSSVTAATAPGVPDKAGPMIIGMGTRFRAKGLQGPDPLDIVEVAQDPGGQGVKDFLSVAYLTSRGAPDVRGKASLILSRSGLEALVAWEEPDGIHFVETTEADSWEEEQVVHFREGLDRDAIIEILADRTYNR